MNESVSPRYLGVDPVTGRSSFVVGSGSGVLDAAADIAGLEAAAALLAVVGSVLETDIASDAELAVFVDPLAEALAEVVSIAAHRLPVNERAHAAARRLMRGECQGGAGIGTAPGGELLSGD